MVAGAEYDDSEDSSASEDGAGASEYEEAAEVGVETISTVGVTVFPSPSTVTVT